MGQISLSIPQVNLPDATEDPKIASDLTTIQSAINGGLDYTNLAANSGISIVTSGLLAAIPAAGNLGAKYFATDTFQWFLDNGTVWMPIGLNQGISNISAAVKAGQMLTMTGASTTATLPSTSGLPYGTLAGVRAGPAILGSGAVTVASQGGTANILTPGASATAATFPLGAAGSFALLAWDNVAWRFVSGQSDSGYVALTLGNVISGDSVTPASRLVGTRVFLRGTVVTSGTITIGAAFVTIPAAMRPAGVIGLPLVAGGTAAPSPPATFQLGTGGNITANVNVGAPVQIALNGVSYDLGA